MPLKICKNEKCKVYGINYHFPNAYRFCPYCATTLVEKNEHEKPKTQDAQVTDRDLAESFKRLAKIISRRWEE